MKKFSELGIKSKRSFVGDKIPVESILDKEIIVEFFEIKPSKKVMDGDCLHLQIKHEGKDRVVFTSSTFLMDPLKQLSVDDFPFKATIHRVNKHFEFK